MHPFILVFTNKFTGIIFDRSNNSICCLCYESIKSAEVWNHEACIKSMILSYTISELLERLMIFHCPVYLKQA